MQPDASHRHAPGRPRGQPSEPAVSCWLLRPGPGPKCTPRHMAHLLAFMGAYLIRNNAILAGKPVIQILVSAGVVDCIDSTSSGLTSKIGKSYEKRVNYITLRGSLPSNTSGVPRHCVSRNMTRVSLNIKRVNTTSSLVSVCDLP